MSMTAFEVAESIVDGIIDDLRGRSGLGNAWDEVDDNDLADEVRDEWIAIASKKLGV